MNTITLPTELVNRILAFLSQQRYGDVVQIIMDIQRAAATQGTAPAQQDSVKRGRNGDRRPIELEE